MLTDIIKAVVIKLFKYNDTVKFLNLIFKTLSLEIEKIVPITPHHQI